MVWNLKADLRGPQGIQGVQGLAGMLADTNDAAVADWISTLGTSLTQTAGDARWSKLSEQPINVMRYGAVGDGTTDNTTAFRAAIADAVSQGRPLQIPAGVFSFTAASGFILPLTAGVTMRGAGRSETTLRIADAAGGISWTALIGSSDMTGTTDLSGLTLSGFTFDHNAPGNPIPSGTDLSTVVRAMAMVPKGSKVRITEIDSINGDGKWVVEMGTTDPTKAATQRVSDSYIDINVYNWGVGSSYHDSSAVYFYGDRNTIRGTYVAAVNAPGAICCIEAHGDSSDVQVTADGFVSLANATGCDYKTNSGVNFHDCVGRNMMNGIAIWSVNLVGAAGYGVNGMTLMNNYLELDPDYWSGTGKASPPGNFAHFGIGISDRGATANLPMANVTIKGNTIVYKPSTQSSQKTLDAGISLIRAAAMSGTPAVDYNIDVSDNNIDSPLSAGVVLDLANTAVNVRADNLRVRNPAQRGAGTVGATYASGVVVRGDFKLLSADNVKVVDDRTTPVVDSAVNFAGVTSTGLIARIGCLWPVVHSVPPVHAVVGPAVGGVFTRMNSYGFVAPTGNIAFNSEIVDYANNHTYRQVASPAGASWQVWSEIRPEGVAVGAANVSPSAPTGLTYMPMTTASGAPSGAPTLRAGMIPIVFDNAGKLWAYVGGAWKGIALA